MQPFNPDDSRAVDSTPAKPEQEAKPKHPPRSHRPLGLAAATLCVFFLFLFFITSGSGHSLKIFFLVLFGWLLYPGRVVSELGPGLWWVGSWAVVSGILCLAAVTVGTHYFARWLSRHSWPWKRTGKLIGLVVLLFLAGLVCTELVEHTLWIIRSPEQWKYPSRYKIGSSVE